MQTPVVAETVNLVTAETDTQVRDEFEFGDVSLVVANPLSDSYADFRCDYELWNIDSGVFLFLGCNVLYSDYFDDGFLRAEILPALRKPKSILNNIIYIILNSVNERNLNRIWLKRRR